MASLLSDRWGQKSQESKARTKHLYTLKEYQAPENRFKTSPAGGHSGHWTVPPPQILFFPSCTFFSFFPFSSSIATAPQKQLQNKEAARPQSHGEDLSLLNYGQQVSLSPQDWAPTTTEKSSPETEENTNLKY